MFWKIPGLVNLYEQALYSLNFFQGAVDYWNNCIPYFWMKFDDRTAWFQHNHWDHSENPGRFLYGSVLSRIILGIRDELPVEKLFKKQIYESILPGTALSYRPNPSPFERLSKTRDIQVDQVGMIHGQPIYIADLWDNRSVFTGLVLNAKVTGDEKAFDAAKRIVEQIKKLAVWDGDCAWFAEQAYPQDYDSSSSECRKIYGQHMGGWISPLVFFYRETADEEALRLASGLALSFVKAYPFIVFRKKNLAIPLRVNNHSLLYTLAGILRVYRITGDKKLLQWAKWQFDAVLEELASEMGWTQEFLPNITSYEGRESCETCAVSDRIDTAIQLALSGFSEYWDDVHRSAINYLIEAQFRNTSWLPDREYRVDDFYRTCHNIRARLQGAYVGWGAPNDLVEPGARVRNSVQNCCGAHGAFGAYQVWHYAINKRDNGLYVNFPISLNSPWCSVLSYHPVSGVIKIIMKTSTLLYIRMSQSVDRKSIKVSINGNSKKDIVVDKDYIKLDVLSGDKVEVDYPLQEVTKEEVLSGRQYRMKWRGDFVMQIEPHGNVAPLFQRDINTISQISSEEVVWPELMDAVEW